MDKENRYVTVQEAHKITKLSEPTISRYKNAGKIKSVAKNGKQNLICLADVIALNIKPRKKGWTRKLNKPVIEIDPARELEQVTIFDFIPDVKRIPKHARKDQEKQWQEPRFTYEDLLEQYNRGYQRGLEEGRNEKENN